MPALNTDKISQGTSSTTGRAVTSSLAAPGHTTAGTSVNISTNTNWPTVSGIHFVIYETTTVGSMTVKDTSTQTDWKGVLSGSTISNMVITGGTDRDYSAGAIVELTFTGRAAKDLYDLITAEHNQDGTHGDINATSLTASGDVTAANFITTGGAGTNGWTVGFGAPDTVAANGNRSYTLTYNATDKTSVVSAGMRLRTERTVSAPTQCTSLNGTTQYYSKSSPAAMTFTDDFVVSAWVKLSSYGASAQTIASRYNGTSGWDFSLSTAGQVQLLGYNASSGNVSYLQSYQSIPLNKWVHVAAQLDMSAFTATTTTSYAMIDGVDVPTTVGRAGTNPTALVQAGNLEIGARNGGTQQPFPGKIAQVAIYNAKVTQATILASINQGLSGSETSLISAYSFNNAITDLSANANNLTANGSAVATNADSPFGTQASGLISATLDYGIIQSVSFSTNTTVVVQVPEGCTIPTSGGVSAVSYSTQASPYGMPVNEDKWVIEAVYTGGIANVQWGGGIYTNSLLKFTVPAGTWRYGFEGLFEKYDTAANTTDLRLTLSTNTSGVTNKRLTCGMLDYAGTQNIAEYLRAEDYVTLAAATTYNHLQYIATGTSVTGYYGGNSSRGFFRDYAYCTYL